MLRFRLLLLVALGITVTVPALSLEVSVETQDAGPFGLSNSVYLSGPVEIGDAEKVWNTIRVLDLENLTARFHVTINSPGGSVTEALDIGRLLSRLPIMFPITTTSSVGMNGEPTATPGDCASACILIYLGATYRFLDPASRIGVHQFSFRDESTLSPAETASITQLLAADVTEYLREVRVDPSLFSVMSQTFPEDIHWIDHEELKAMRVVNEHIYDQSAEYKNADGAYYLLLWQQSYWGENKIVATCVDGRTMFQAYLQPPDLALVASREHELTVLVDGEEFTPIWRTVPIPTARFGVADFSLDTAQLARFTAARSVGARMMIPGAPVFFGFEMNLPDSKLQDTIVGCINPALAASRRPASTEPVGMTRLPGFDFAGGDLLPNGLRNVTLEACETACQSEPACIGVSYVTGSQWCWPKRTLTAPRRMAGVVSSVKP
jgi:hypothetical protein